MWIIAAVIGLALLVLGAAWIAALRSPERHEMRGGVSISPDLVNVDRVSVGERVRERRPASGH